jgi:hypothetical protein
MSFTFPDPSVSTTATNPETGITYEYADGMWTPVSTDAEQDAVTQLIADDDRQDVEIQGLKSGETIDRQLLVQLSNRVGTNEIDISNIENLDITSALSALAIAQQDIIELKSKVSSLELTSFLILE